MFALLLLRVAGVADSSFGPTDSALLAETQTQQMVLTKRDKQMDGYMGKLIHNSPLVLRREGE